MLLLLLCSLSLGFASSKANDPKSYRAIRLVHAPPAIDGKLTDEAWQTGHWEGDFTQFEPFNGTKPSQATYFKVLFDDNNLYVAIRAMDSAPDSIITRLTGRDHEDGDNVAIAFDSFFDRRTAFVFGVSASGVKFDNVITNDGQGDDPTWNPNWWVRTSTNEEGWIAEIRIPLSQLRFERGGDGVWGMQVMRSIYRKRETSLWSHIPRGVPGLVRHSGLLEGLGNLEPRRTFDVTPYTVAMASRYPAAPDNPFRTGRDHLLKTGLDAKIGLSNNFTLDMTVNPDFGQVEADPSEVNLTAFETFFEEKRPFFIEGRNISSFPLGLGDGGIGNDNLFYSRRIGRQPRGRIQIPGGAFADVPAFTRILGAAKVTGKTNDGLSLAVIHSVTAEEQAEIDNLGTRSFETVEPLTNFMVGRVQKDFNQGRTLLGGMVTGVARTNHENLNQQMHRNAFSGGIDFTQFSQNREWSFNVNAALSHVSGTQAAIMQTQQSSARLFQRPDATNVQLDPTRTSLTGTGGRVQLARFGGGHWNYMAAVLWKSPEFEINDLGYMREADQILSILYTGYRQWQPGAFYRAYNIDFVTYTMWNFEGLRLGTGGNINGSIQFKNFWSARAGLEFNGNMVSVSHLRGGPAIKLPGSLRGWIGFGTDNRKRLFARLQSNFGTSPHKFGHQLSISPSVTYMPMDNLSLSVQPSFTTQVNDLQYIRAATFGNQQRYIFGNIAQQTINLSFRLNYAVLPGLTIQYWGQPFISSGEFSKFKHITNPMAERYTERFNVFDPTQISFSNGRYLVDENRDGSTDYSFRNPDFLMSEFLSNLVIQWEYSPGSSIYLVWSQSRTKSDSNPAFEYFNEVGDLFALQPTNIFLAKFTYRIGLR